MKNLKKNVAIAVAALTLYSGTMGNVYANEWVPNTPEEQPNQIVNDGVNTPGVNENVEIPVYGFVGNAYDDVDTDGDGNTDLKPNVSKINVSVPLKMKFAVIGNLVGEDKFTAPEYEVINSGANPVDITVKEFTGNGSSVPVVDASLVSDKDAADKHIALDLTLGTNTPVNLKTEGFASTTLGTVDSKETQSLKLTSSAYGKDFSKFKEDKDNKNTSYTMVWSIKESTK